MNNEDKNRLLMDISDVESSIEKQIDSLLDTARWIQQDKQRLADMRAELKAYYE